jgi:hypothetical protein
MKVRTILPVALVVTLGLSAFAHDGNEHVRGVVTAIGENSITLETPAKESVTVNFDSSTKFEKAGVKAEVKDLNVGERVVIDIHRKDGKMHGSLVRFGSAKKADAAKEKHKH